MENFNGAVIAKYVKNNRPVGAVIFRVGLPNLQLNSNGVTEIGNFIRTQNQKLANAIISTDGRIIPRKGKTVQELQVGGVANLHGKVRQDGKVVLDAPVTQEPINSTVHTRQECEAALSNFNIFKGKAELRLLSVIHDGLLMAREAGVYCGGLQSAEDISIKQGHSGTHTPYLYVSVECNDIEPVFVPRIVFAAFLNGSVSVTVEYADIMAVTPTMTIKCKNATDIRNALIWLVYRGSRKRKAYEKYKYDVGRLIAESNAVKTNTSSLDKSYAVLELMHRPIKASPENELRSLREIVEHLQSLFPFYTFALSNISERTAGLSVSKRTSNVYNDAEFEDTITTNAFSNELLSLRLDFHSCQPRNRVNIGYKVNVSNKSRFGGRVVWLREFQQIEWLDKLGDAVKLIIDSVFSAGVFRDSVDVVAWGIIRGERHYLIRGQEKPVNEQNILSAAKEGKLVNNVCLAYNADEFSIRYPGYDTKGSEIPKFGEIDGEYIIRVPFGFLDRVRGEWTEIKTALKWNVYKRISSTDKKLSANLTHPTKYIRGMLTEPFEQRAAIKHLCDTLTTYMIERGYSTDERKTAFISSFMQSCRFIPLDDTVHANKSPVEMLLEKSGCCVELSLFAAVVSNMLGIESAVIFRYSPSIKTSMYHAVTGVKAKGISLNDTQGFCWRSKRDGDSEYNIVSLDGYTGFEAGGNAWLSLGIASYWSVNNHAAVGKQSGVYPSQVVVVPITWLLSDLKALAEAPIEDVSGEKRLIELKKEHWQTVVDWFEKIVKDRVKSEYQADFKVNIGG